MIRNDTYIFVVFPWGRAGAAARQGRDGAQAGRGPSSRSARQVYTVPKRKPESIPKIFMCQLSDEY